MVRLEIKMPYFSIAFTLDLHSSMVRLEISIKDLKTLVYSKFTFQYG